MNDMNDNTMLTQLSRRDPVLKVLIKKYGACALKPIGPNKYFESLVDAIISQQISARAAATMYKRFTVLLKGSITAQDVLKLSDAKMRSAGISPQKAAYLRDLAKRWQDGAVRHRTFAKLTDEEVIHELIAVKGIGRWTAEMFLIVSLGRLDVLPVDDLGLQKAIQKAYGLQKRPSERTIRRIAEHWKPYRSVGVWYMWKSLDNKPMS